MDNIQLLFEQNSVGVICRKPMFQGKCAVFKCCSAEVTFGTLKSVFGFVKSLKRLPKLPVLFDFSQSPFADKLTILVFECICYTLISEYGYYVRVKYCVRRRIKSEGVHSSPLLLLASDKLANNQKYCEKFRDDVFQLHFRRCVPAIAVSDGSLGFLMHDIECFLRNLDVKDEYRSQLSEVIVELVGNAGEHGNTECLIDIDVTTPYGKENADGEYRGLNFALIGFSDRLFGEELQEKMTRIRFSENEERYAYVNKALEVHNGFFGSNYRQMDFFRIAAFQHKISGRMNKSMSGGTGLTKLIASLEDMADAHSCYMVTGNRAILFRREYLEYDENGWIGFNKERSFCQAPPDPSVLANSKVYIPGTAYNLCFVMREDI